MKWRPVLQEDGLDNGKWRKVNGVPSAIELSACTNKRHVCSIHQEDLWAFTI